MKQRDKVNPAETDKSARRGEVSLLGRSETRLPASPDEARIEVFANRTPGRRYRVTLDCREFTSLCPVTGQPDMARIRICYEPAETCVETKSVKFYLASFRNTEAFNEDVVNRILDDLVAACAPRAMVVRGDFGSRGGIRLTCQAAWPEDCALAGMWEGAFFEG